MKPVTALLAASLVANAALVTVYAMRTAESGSPAPASAAPGTAPTPTPAASTPASPASATAARTAWDRLQTDDLTVLVRRLGEAGFPPAVIRRVVATLVKERFDGRRLEAEKAGFEAPLGVTPGDPKIAADLRLIQREQTDLIKKILGGNLSDVFASTADEKAMLRLQVGDMSPEKIEQLYAAGQSYGEKMSALYGAQRNGGPLLDRDREQIAAGERAFREELGKFLTPTEANELLMRSSVLGSQLLSTLAPFRPTEQEYRAIFPLYQAFQDEFPQQGDLPPAQAESRRLAQERMNDQLKTILGADRAAEYQQAIDPKMQQLNRLVARLDLPLSAAIQVSALQAEATQRATALRSNTAGTPQQQLAQYTALNQEMTARVSAALGGPRGLEAYRLYGGQWLGSAPQPARPAATAPK